MSIRKNVVCGTLASILLSGIVSFELAVAAEESDQKSGSTQLEEITVTAQRRSQGLQSVPITVSVLTESNLKNGGFTRLEEYFATVPGLSYQQIGAGERNGQNLAVRGVSNTRLFAVSDGTASQTVGFYMNDVPVQAVDNKLFDVAQVEVLKGPQGTLYGQASLGGTIKVVTNEPVFNELQAAFEGTGSFTEGAEASHDYNGMINIPLAEDSVSLRAVAYHRVAGGYIDWHPADPENPFERRLSLNGASTDDNELFARVNQEGIVRNANRETTTGSRVSLLWQPTENVRISPFVWYQDRQSDFDNAYDRDLNAGLVQRRFLPSPRKENFSMAALPIEVSLGFANLDSITSYYNREAAWLQDLNVLAFNIFGGSPTGGIPALSIPSVENESKSVSQEFRLTSNAGAGPEWLDWVLGASYYEEDRFSPIFWQAPGYNDNVVPGGGISRSDELIQSAKQDFNFSAVGIFGDITMRLSDALAVSVGLRWYDTDQSFTRFDNGALAPCDASAGVCQSSDVQQAESGSTPRANFSYNLTDSNMLYASVAEGFRAGGFNNSAQLSTPDCTAAVAAAGLDPNNPGFKSDSVVQYEIGMKNSFSNGRQTLNAAVFFIEWDDLQQSVALTALDPICPFSATSNVGSAEIKGFEVESSMRPTDNLSLGGGLSYTDAEIGPPPPGVPDREGYPVQGVPDWTGSAFASYDFDILGEHPSYFRVDFQYVGERKGPGFVIDNPFFTEKAFSLTNLRLGMNYGNAEFIVFIDNLFDETPEYGALPLAGESFTNQVLIGRPRTAGITFRYSL